MDHYLTWLIAGFLLVIVELLSGTFYLLVLGIAAMAVLDRSRVGAQKAV